MGPGNRTVVATTLLAVPAHLAYVAAVVQQSGSPFMVRVYAAEGVALRLLLVGVAVATSLLAWRRGFRVAPALCLAGLLAWPLLYLPVPFPRAGYLMQPVAIAAFVGLVEAGVGHRRAVEGLLRGPGGRSALAVGAAHFVAGFALQVYTRRFVLFDGSASQVGVYAAAYVLSGVFLVVTGAAAVLAWRRRRLVTPAVTVAGWFLWGTVGTLLLSPAPRSAFYSVLWTTLPPYPDYLLHATTLLVLVAGAGLVESGIRRLPYRSAPTASSTES